MDFEFLDAKETCWRIADAILENHPPKERAEECLPPVADVAEERREYEVWYHSKRLEAFQEVAEILYGAGIPVWKWGQESVDTGDYGAEATETLSLDRGPVGINATVDSDAPCDVEEGLSRAVSVIIDHLQSAETIDAQLIWEDVLVSMVVASHSEVSEWIVDNDLRVTKQRDGQALS